MVIEYTDINERKRELTKLIGVETLASLAGDLRA